MVIKSIVAITIALGLIVGGYFLYIVNGGTSVPVVDTAPESVIELANFKTVLKEADQTFVQERNYDKSNAQIESIASNISDENGLKTIALIRLGQNYLRTDMTKAAEILIGVYNDPDTVAEAKEAALETMSWHIVSNYSDSDQGVNNEYVNWVMGPQGFNILREGSAVEDRFSMATVTIAAFEKLIAANSERYVSHIMLAETIGQYKTDLDLEDLNVINHHLSEGLKYLDKDLQTSLASNEHYSQVSGMLYHVVKTYFRLYQEDLVESSKVYESADMAFAYADQFRDQDFTAEVVGVETATRKMIVMAIDSNYNLNESQKEEVTSMLDKYFYQLAADDIERRRTLRGHGGNPSKFTEGGLERRKALVYIANSVDPRFKEFLITKIGVWTEKDFVTKN